MKSKKNISVEESLSIIDGIIGFGINGNIISANEAVYKITGYKKDDIILKNYQILFQNSIKSIQYIKSALIDNKSFSNIPIVFTRKNGKLVHVLASITPVDKSVKGALATIMVFRDTRQMITLSQSLKKINQEIVQKEYILESIFNSRIEGTFTVNKDLRITSFNYAAEKITGYSVDEAMNNKYWNVFKPTTWIEENESASISELGETTANTELSILHKDGHQIPLRVNSAPLFDNDKNFIGAVKSFQDISELQNLTAHVKGTYHYDQIIGKSKAMQDIYVKIESVGFSNSTVLITGESGTGKELVARAIHINSDRKNGPFHVVNCSVFAETLLESEMFGHEKGAFTGATSQKPGRFEMAKQGTLFIDEIGDLSPAVQVKLLRVLETHQFERVGGTIPINLNARIITATNKNLTKEIEENRFREDLYYRINIINIHLPPLRNRMDDLPLLVEEFMKRFRKRFNKNIQYISSNAFNSMKEYDWPGNIRSLENALEHAFILCRSNTIRTAHLPERIFSNDPVNEQNKIKKSSSNILFNTEKDMIKETLKRYYGHRGKTAKALGIHQSTLWRKMKKFELI